MLGFQRQERKLIIFLFRRLAVTTVAERVAQVILDFVLIFAFEACLYAIVIEV